SPSSPSSPTRRRPQGRRIGGETDDLDRHPLDRLERQLSLTDATMLVVSSPHVAIVVAAPGAPFYFHFSRC
ncbi:MAG TPA: hypothetical protein VEI94_13285, partial [Candidatus Bathyarchaeia archaeon]|nr:hypothetical protein [Candidatus Bathyarchaeia archaeon]